MLDRTQTDEAISFSVQDVEVRAVDAASAGQETTQLCTMALTVGWSARVLDMSSKVR